MKTSDLSTVSQLLDIRANHAAVLQHGRICGLVPTRGGYLLASGVSAAYQAAHADFTANVESIERTWHARAMQLIDARLAELGVDTNEEAASAKNRFMQQAQDAERPI